MTTLSTARDGRTLGRRELMPSMERLFSEAVAYRSFPFVTFWALSRVRCARFCGRSRDQCSIAVHEYCFCFLAFSGAPVPISSKSTDFSMRLTSVLAELLSTMGLCHMVRLNHLAGQHEQAKKYLTA